MTFILVNSELAEEGVPVLAPDERGFRLGDGVFETIPFFSGIPYLWEFHLERLCIGLAALKMDFDAGTLQKDAAKLLQANKAAEGLLRISVSRGRGSIGYLPFENIIPTVIMEILPAAKPPAAPVTLWLSSYEKPSPKALPTHCKTAQGLNSVLARLEAAEHGAYDALLCDASGYIAEASSANLFFLHRGTLRTPSLATGALAGVTRRRVMELSPYPVEEGHYTLSRLTAAEAVIITNAAGGIVAVGALAPGGVQWDSIALARELSALRATDIAAYRLLRSE